MLKKRSSSYRGRLVDLIESKGFSRRKADRAVAAVFRCMSRAIRRGELVEVPGGILQAVTAPPVRRQWKRYKAFGKVSFRVVVYHKRKRRIKFTPDPNFFGDSQ